MSVFFSFIFFALLISSKAPAQEGLVKENFSDGSLRRAAHYSQGKLDGTYEEYDESGTLTLKGAYKNDKKHGLFQVWQRKTGKLLSEMTYVDNTKHGLYRKWDENGKLSVELVMFENKEKFRGFYKKYEDGYLVEHSSWNQGEREGKYLEFWAKGKRKIAGSYRLGKEHGYFSYWDEAGYLERRCYFVDGDKDGVELTYFPGGQIHEKASYRAGVLHGRFERFDSEGKVIQVLSYKDGDLDGTSTEYMKNGKPRVTASYKNGQRHGKTNIFFANGSLACEVSFEGDELHGERRCNYRDGATGLVEQWESGVLKSAEYRDPHGKILEKGHYFDDASLRPEFFVP